MAVKNSSARSQQLNDLCVYFFSLNPKPRQRYRQLEAAWAGAAWIEEDYSVTIGKTRLMRVAADDGMESFRRRIDFQIIRVVDDKQANAVDVQMQNVGDFFGPRFSVVVAADRQDWRY